MEIINHPAADAFPMMDQNRYQELVNDIGEHGQREPITLCGGMILDGRNRYKACRELGITPTTKDFDGDPWAFVWSLNGQRRDLVAEQRYLIWKFCHEQSDAFQAEKARIHAEANRKRSAAAKVQHEVSKPYAGEKMVPRQNVGLPQNVGLRFSHLPPATASKAAASKTNPGAVARGDKIAKERPDLAEGIRQGTIKPAEAHRLMKKDEVKGKIEALPEGKHRVIYADPPWKYGDGRTGDLMTATGALHHYPTMPLSELKALDIKNLSADDSVLFLWATSPLLEDALELCKAWGFAYKAHFIWDKVKHNMGHYNSVRHELLLICTRGSGTPEVTKLFDSVQVIERQEHSRKPEEFRTIIDTLYPTGQRIELFCRGEKPEGWKTWGNEAE